MPNLSDLSNPVYTVSTEVGGQSINHSELKTLINANGTINASRTCVGITDNTEDDDQIIVHFDDDLTNPTQTNALTTLLSGSYTYETEANYTGPIYAEETVETLDSNFGYNSKVTLTTPKIPADDYEVDWSFEIFSSQETSYVGYRVLLNGTTTLLEGKKMTMQDEYELISGFSKQTLSEGVHTVTIDYLCESIKLSGVGVRNARLKLQKL